MRALVLHCSVLFGTAACATEFTFEIQVAPVRAGVQVTANAGVVVAPASEDDGRISVTRSFDDYTDARSTDGIDLVLSVDGAVFFAQTLGPGACAPLGDEWERETFFVSVAETAGALDASVGGYECQNGSLRVKAVP